MISRDLKLSTITYTYIFVCVGKKNLIKYFIDVDSKMFVTTYKNHIIPV